MRDINSILNQQTRTDNPKRVTFADPIPEPRVPAYKTSDANQAQPRTLPRVVDAQVEKRIGESVEHSRPRRSERHAAISQLTDFAAAMQIMENETKSETAFKRANAIFDAKTNTGLKYRKLITHPDYQAAWNKSSANEFGRLAQGVGDRIKGTDTIFFVNKTEIPLDRRKDVTYGKFICELKPNKAEQERTRLTVGGDKINYTGHCGTPTADLTLVKVHLNSVISTLGARYMTVDIKNFYLNTPMARYEYVHLKIDDIPQNESCSTTWRKKLMLMGTCTSK